MNLKMPALNQALEATGFTDVKTLLSSEHGVQPAQEIAGGADGRSWAATGHADGRRDSISCSSAAH